MYLKGLCVVDDIAFFGIAESREREKRDSEDLSCELAAFDLLAHRLLWQRKLPTKGLLNVVSAPHLHVESTYKAVYLDNKQISYRLTDSYQDAIRASKVKELNSKELPSYPSTRVDISEISASDASEFKSKSTQHEGIEHAESGKEHPRKKIVLEERETLAENDPLYPYPPKIGGYWESGYPRLDNSLKGFRGGFESGVQLRLFRVDLSSLRNALLSLPEEAWTPDYQSKYNAFLDGRSQNLNQFKPDISAIHIIFSDRNGDAVFEFPWYRSKFKHLLDPLLDELLGKDVENIIRIQFAKMPPHTHIKKHVDSGGYSQTGHRIHFIVSSNPAVKFHVCYRESCLPLQLEQDLVFELNNRLAHYVDNDGTEDRIHMVVDVAEESRARTPLKVGQRCIYVSGKIKCPDEGTGEVAEI